MGCFSSKNVFSLGVGYRAEIQCKTETVREVIPVVLRRVNNLLRNDRRV